MYADDKPASPITARDTGSTRTTTNPVTESAADAEISPTSTAADTSVAATVHQALAPQRPF